MTILKINLRVTRKTAATLVCYAIFFLLTAIWVSAACELFQAWQAEEIDFRGFFLWNMLVFAVIAWAILSLPYFLLRGLYPNDPKLPSYRKYMFGG